MTTYCPPRRTLTAILAIGLTLTAGTTMADQWLAFRGTDQTGVGHAKGLPARFSLEDHVAWRVELPGSGPSSPIVVGDLVVVTAASGAQQERLQVLALEKGTGRTRWRRQFWATGHTAINEFGGVAANTPASDGKQIVAMFSSNDVVCLDTEGNLLWFRGLAYDFPTVRNDVGMASSPVIVGDIAVVQCENQGKSFVAGLDLATGETRWILDRSRETVWSSPTVLRGEPGDEPIILLCGRDGLTGVDPATGERVFLYEADTNTMASATPRGRDIFFPAWGVHHLRYDPETRDVELLWHARKLSGSAPSPVVTDDRIYVMRSPSFFVEADAATGEILSQTRVEGRQFWATPVVAGRTAYIVPYGGLVQAVDLGADREIIGKSKIDEGCLATPAVDENAIYFRTRRSLWKVTATP